MSLNFPSGPAPGDIFTSQGVTFVWTGTVWVIPPAGLRFATEVEARGGVVADRAMTPLRGAQAIDEFDAPPPGPGAAPAAICIAICAFDGVTGAILFEKNILSIAGAGTGSYTLTFRNPPPDKNYTVFGSAIGITNHPLIGVAQNYSLSSDLAAVVNVGTTGGNLSTQVGFLVASPLIHVGFFK